MGKKEGLINYSASTLKKKTPTHTKKTYRKWEQIKPKVTYRKEIKIKVKYQWNRKTIIEGGEKNINETKTDSLKIKFVISNQTNQRKKRE